MNFSPVFQPDASNSREKALKLFTKASMDKPQSFEWKQQRPDGLMFDAAILLNRFAMNGAPYLQASVRNITDQKLSDNIIRKSEEQYRRIVETAEEGIWLLNAQNETTFVNSKLSRMLGYSPDEMIGCPFIAFIDPLFHDEAEANLETRQHGICNQLEFKCRRRDGTDLWALLSTSLIFGKSGQYVGALVMLTDITERKKTDDASKETNEALKALILASPLAITVINQQNTVDLWSPAAERLFGWNADEVLCKPLPIVPTDQIEDFHKMLAEEFAGQSRTGIELLRLCKDGSLIDVSLWSSPVRNSQGAIIATLGLYADMRSHKHLESQLIMAQKMEALGKVAGGVAHDFNNILTAIIGYAYMLQENLEDKQLLGHVKHINHAVERATGLTNSLLAFSRRKIISLKPVDVNVTIKKSEKLLSRLIREDIEINTILNDENLTILGDDTQIDQVTMNLVTNARDAMPNGGTLTVRTDRFIMGPEFIAKHGYGKPAEYALITVSDSGTGMDEKTQESAFEPFFTTKDVGKGTGLGLSTVYGIVKQLEGYITIESEWKKGTTFKIYLPLIEEVKEKISDYSSTSPSGGVEAILIGEDDPDVRQFVKGLLEGYGYSVIDACDGEDSVSKFKMNRDVIKLVILDIIMPKKNGRDAYEEMRKLRPEIKTLFMSGYAGDVLNSKGIHEEGLNFIAKPLLPVELLNKVRSVLDQEI